MNESPVVAIKIIKEIPLFGPGDTLETRLRRVTLRGFKEIKIYEKAQFETEFLAPEQINKTLHTPQPNVYRTHLSRIERLTQLFGAKGIDILNLDRAYDFVARSENGEETEWTMIPPIVEEWNIPRDKEEGLDYTGLIGEELEADLQRQGLKINPDLKKLMHTSESGIFNLINDGTHRIHYGYLNKGIKIIKVKSVTSGFPYYAAPQRYDSVKIVPEPTEETTAMKVHIVESPGQKALYRLFPSGGIMTGEVRPPTKGELFT